MKKAFILSIALFAVVVLSAQKRKLVVVDNVKIGLSNLIYGDYSVSVERRVTNQSSLNLRLGYLQPFHSAFKYYEIDLDGKKDGFDGSLEYRFFFTGKKRSELLGFYVGPYLRFANLKLNFVDHIEITPFHVNFAYSNIGAGIQLGFQNELKSQHEFLKNIVYDFYFLGGGIDRHQLKLGYRELKNPEEFDYGSIEDDIEAYFEKIPFIQGKLNYNVAKSLLNIKLPLVLPGIRVGFSVGYRF